MKASASNRKMVVDRAAERVGGLPIGLRRAGLATMTLLFWTASAAAGLYVDGPVEIRGVVTTDYVVVTNNGTLTITMASTLILTGDPNNTSYVNGMGKIYLEANSELRFTTADHTITYDGTPGAIIGRSNDARITLDSDNLDLTSNITIGGALAITEFGDPNSTSFVNSGTIRADVVGTLNIDVDSFGGSGDWRVANYGTAELLLSTSSSSLSGDFGLSCGRLTVADNVDISTIGDLRMFDNGAVVDVGNSASIAFNQ